MNIDIMIQYLYSTVSRFWACDTMLVEMCQISLFKIYQFRAHGKSASWLCLGGARVDLVDIDGHSALHWAALGGNLEVCEVLMENGISPNLQDHAGRTPLQCAAYAGYINCMALLIQHDADPNIQDKEVANTENMYWPLPTSGLLEIWKRERLKNSMKSNFCVCLCVKGRTALHWSCNNGYLDAVKLLLGCGTFPNHMEHTEER